MSAQLVAQRRLRQHRRVLLRHTHRLLGVEELGNAMLSSVDDGHALLSALLDGADAESSPVVTH